MNAIEAEMQKSLQAISKEATFHYANSRRVDWIKSNIGMVGLSGSQVRLSLSSLSRSLLSDFIGGPSLFTSSHSLSRFPFDSTFHLVS